MDRRIIIKVCGMRTANNIRALESIDIDWMGFIFYPASPRCITDEDEYLPGIQSCSKVKVGVFVNEREEDIAWKAAKYRLDAIQLHGDEPPDFCSCIRNLGYKVIKAFPIASETDIQRTSEYENHADYFLFDAKGIAERGGTGTQFDWAILKTYKGAVPFILSGGIGAEHITELNELRHPMFAGIDLNSRFERAPALKDTYKVEGFVSQIRSHPILKKK